MRRSVKLATLDYALITAEEGSFLRAARRAGIDHTALSRRMADLEQALGVKLFERHARGVTPTAAGRRVLGGLRQVLGDLDMTLAMARSCGDAKTGRLSIGFTGALSGGERLDAIAAFANARPGLAVCLIEGPCADLAAGLSTKQLDIAVVTGTGVPPGDLGLSLRHDRLVIVLPKNHPLGARTFIEWTELHGQTVLLGENADIARDGLVLPDTAEGQRHPVVARHLVARDSLIALVRVGMGLALLLESEVAAAGKDFVCLELRHRGRPIRIPTAARWRSDNSNPMLAEFVRVLRQRYS